jgi:hypothetical protein
MRLNLNLLTFLFLRMQGIYTCIRIFLVFVRATLVYIPASAYSWFSSELPWYIYLHPHIPGFRPSYLGIYTKVAMTSPTSREETLINQFREKLAQSPKRVYSQSELTPLIADLRVKCAFPRDLSERTFLRRLLKTVFLTVFLSVFRTRRY